MRRGSVGLAVGLSAGLLLVIAGSPVTAAETPTAESEPLAIVGAQAGGLEIQAPLRKIEHPFTIEATGAEVANVTVAVAPLVGPDAQPVIPIWTIDGKPGNQPFTVPALRAVTLVLKADLPVSGRYESAITLIHGERRSTKLVIQRTRPVLPVEIQGIEKVRGKAGDVTLWLTAQSTSDREVKVRPPVLATLAREEKDKSRTQARFKKFQVYDEDGNLLAKPFDLGAGELKRLRLDLPDLSDAGTYVGKVRISAEDMQPVDADLTLLVRKGAWRAGWLIFLGVLISFLLRRYLGGVRPRLVRRRRLVGFLADLQRMVERLDGGPRGAERAMLDRLRQDMESLDEDIGLGSDRNADAQLDSSERKLRLLPGWLNLGRQVEALEPPSLRPPLRIRLQGVETLLEKNLLTDAEAQQAQTALTEIEAAIPAAVRQEMLDRIAAFRTQSGQPTALVTTEAKLRLTQEVEPDLKAAEEHVEAARMPEARAALQKARGRYARVLATDLTATLATTPQPVTATPGAWKSWKDRVREKLDQARNEPDPERAITAYQAAAVLFLAEIARFWLPEVEQLSLRVQADPKLKPEQKTEQTTLLREVAGHLRNAAARAEALETGAAATEYAAAQEKLAPLLRDLKNQGIQMNASGDPEPELPGAPGQIPAGMEANPILLLPAFSAHRRPSVGEISRRLFWSDFWFTAAILLIAVFLGLKLLWMDDLTWGDPNDHLVAVLWGLGMHQVSGAAFEGVNTLADRFRS
jgi:hypothetical protein